MRWAAGSNSQTYTQSGGNVLNWKLQETQSYQNDVWGFNLTERWYSPVASFTNRNTIVCAARHLPGADDPDARPSTSTRLISIFYLDVGVNWNVSAKTQLYTKIDNVTNIRPPDIGSQDNNQVV